MDELKFLDELNNLVKSYLPLPKRLGSLLSHPSSEEAGHREKLKRFIYHPKKPLNKKGLNQVSKTLSDSLLRFENERILRHIRKQQMSEEILSEDLMYITGYDFHHKALPSRSKEGVLLPQQEQIHFIPEMRADSIIGFNKSGIGYVGSLPIIELVPMNSEDTSPVWSDRQVITDKMMTDFSESYFKVQIEIDVRISFVPSFNYQELKLPT